MSKMTQQEKTVLIDKLVRTLNRRRTVHHDAHPCPDAMKYLKDDEESMQEIETAKKKLKQLDKSIDSMLIEVKKAFPNFKKQQWSSNEILFVLVLLSTVYSDLSYDSQDLIPLVLREDVSELTAINKSMASGNLYNLVNTDAKFGHKFRYSFKALELAEKFILGDE